MTPLEDIIRRRIALQGPMPLAEYMALCLGHPRHGYYTTRDPFGPHGDFVTAPEISQTFGEMIGAWLADRWVAAGGPAPFTLAELGPGRGTLMADVLRTTRGVPGFLDAATIALVETSDRMRNQQRANIQHLVHFANSADDLPAGPLFLIANEFVDALPAHQVRRAETGWETAHVLVDEANALALAYIPDPTPAADVPALPGAIENGAVIELQPAAAALAERIGGQITDAGGAALIIDYGYGAAWRSPTLRAFRRHTPVGIFHEPGTCDLTVSVDFAVLAAAARAAGAAAHGPIDQGRFLRALGIEARRDALIAQNPDRADDVRSGVARLIDPADMGARFKVLAITPADGPPPPGFPKPAATQAGVTV